MKNILYRHKGNGLFYVAIGTATDKTNDNANLVVVYHPNSDPEKLYTRDVLEFMNKFELVESGQL